MKNNRGNRREIKRRDVLRNLTILSIGASSFSGSSSAAKDTKEHSHDILAKYHTPEFVKKTFELHTEDLLKLLVDQDVINSTNVSSLDAFKRLDGDDEKSIPTADNSREEPEDLVVMSIFDEQTETTTAVIRVIQKFERGNVKIFALPEADRRYAIVKYDAGEPELIKPKNGANSPRTADENCGFTRYEHDCTTEVCNSGVDHCSPYPGIWLECDWEHYLMEEYAVYCCDHINAENEPEDSSCWRELEYKYCSNQCCSDMGNGCDASGCGCSA